MKKSKKLLLLVFILNSFAYGQTRPGTDTELKALYCMGYYKQVLNMLNVPISCKYDFLPDGNEERRKSYMETCKKNKIDVQNAIIDFKNKQKRVFLYMSNRIDVIDSFDFVMAITKFDKDMKKIKSCTSMCSEQKEKACKNKSDFIRCYDDFDKKTNCNDNCVGKEIPSRIESCKNLSWLPY